MKPEKVIAGKYVLIVDDEQDVLDTLVELLDMCRLDTASSFNEAKKLLEENQYEIAVLDIMGVDGYKLLEIAKGRTIPAEIQEFEDALDRLHHHQQLFGEDLPGGTARPESRGLVLLLP